MKPFRGCAWATTAFVLSAGCGSVANHAQDGAAGDAADAAATDADGSGAADRPQGSDGAPRPCDDLGTMFSDVNNPNPPWTFGWFDGTTFHRYADHGDAATNGFSLWFTQIPGGAIYSVGLVGKNESDQVVHIPGGLVLQPREIIMHPGSMGEF